MMEDGWAIAAPGIPEDWTPLEFSAVIKCITAEGKMNLVYTVTPDLNDWEAIGMITSLLDSMRACMSENIDYGDDE